MTHGFKQTAFQQINLGFGFPNFAHVLDHIRWNHVRGLIFKGPKTEVHMVQPKSMYEPHQGTHLSNVPLVRGLEI